MPERSFGRTVRYRRTKLGMSHARLGQLVGRSPATIRSWEADKSTPSDPAVVSVLAAIIGFDERALLEKAGIEQPVYVETSPTIEEALASLAPDRQPESADPVDDEAATEPVAPPLVEAIPVSIEEITEPVETVAESGTSPLFDPLGEEEGLHLEELLREFEDLGNESPEEISDLEAGETEQISAVSRRIEEAPVSGLMSPVSYQGGNGRAMVQPVVVAVEASYIENPAEKRFYQFRTLATVGGLVVLGVAFLWAVGKGLGEFTQWWSNFLEQLRL